MHNEAIDVTIFNDKKAANQTAMLHEQLQEAQGQLRECQEQLAESTADRVRLQNAVEHFQTDQQDEVQHLQVE